MTTGDVRRESLMQGDEFDSLLNDVLHRVANPEVPERVRVRVSVTVQELREQPMHIAAPDSGGMNGRVVPADVFVDFQRRMQPHRDLRSTAFALAAHAAAIALVFWAVARHVQFAAPVKTVALTQLTPPPPIAPQKAQAMGGGGGQRGPTPVAKGALPKFADHQITPPAPPPVAQPKIRLPDPTIEVQKDLKMATSDMPNFGMPNSPLLGNSLGNGNGTGIGTGSGSGLGPGSGGNYGGGLRKIGGGVSRPELLVQVDPEFSEEARKAKFMGTVTVDLIVDARGLPQNVRVVHGVGMGLDQKALEAVRQYRFKPAMEAGHPVPVEMNVQVNFQIF